MNLIHMRHLGSLKAYVCKYSTQMNGTIKKNEFAKKCSALYGVAKVGGECLILVSIAFGGCGRDLQNCKSILADGPPKKKLGGTLLQSGFRGNKN